MRVRLDRVSSCDQFRQSPLRAHVVQLNQFQVNFRLHRRGNRQKAIETARVEGSVLVLRSAIHTVVHLLKMEQGFSIVRIHTIAERDSYHAPV